MNAPPRPSTRHQPERRRRPRAAPLPAESWFGSLGAPSDGPLPDDELYDADSAFDARGADALGDDSRYGSAGAARSRAEPATAFDRIYGAFVAARPALGLALLLAQIVTEVFGVSPPLLVELVCLVYAIQATGLWLLPRLHLPGGEGALRRLRGGRWWSTIGVDTACFALLHVMAPATGLNYVPLFVLPVLMSGVLAPRLPALATAAAVAIVLIGSAWSGVLRGADPTSTLTQAALAGSGFFVITLLAGEVAGRLAREELSARGSLEFARQQAQLNRLVIEEMQDGVLVVDRKGRVRAANPAARSLLVPTGLARSAPFQLHGVEAWKPLVESVERAFAEASWPEAGRDVLLAFADGAQRTLRLRVRFTRRRAPRTSEEFCVLFIEDLRSVHARMRQEKLAAMGRVSAGIAHEIRNPLAAIAQANALLAEDAIEPGQHQLTKMIGDNVARLKRIVDDVMEVAPGPAPEAGVIDVGAVVASTCVEWARTAGIVPGDGGPLRLVLSDDRLGVHFDEEHLRRVLVNLLDNALRHGGGVRGSIEVALTARDEQSIELGVASGGAPIAPEVERFLFEPFFSTRSRGTGLGLYICRELCERYGASIDYHQRSEGEPNRNLFLLVMQRRSLPALPAAESRSLFTP